jgi:hypothetical protein
MPTSMITLMPKRRSDERQQQHEADLRHLAERLDERRLGRLDLVQEEIRERVVELERMQSRNEPSTKMRKSRCEQAAARRARARRAR